MPRLNLLRIAIRGLSASGKGEVAKLVAKKIKAVHIDCGIIFRAIALRLSKTKDGFHSDIDSLAVAKEGMKSSQELQSEKVGLLTSKFCCDKGNERHLISVANEVINLYPRVVLDGRNAGLTICPMRNFSFFLTVPEDERVLRRSLQTNQPVEETRNSIRCRDDIDFKRDPALCTPQRGEVVISNAARHPWETADQISKIISSRN